MAKVLLVFSGCGVMDGTEIHEAVSVLIHLDRRRIPYTIAAPDVAQARVINHLTGKVIPGDRRNVLIESARIARGHAVGLADIRGDEFDAIIFPGGYGAALNLCTFAADGDQCSVNPDVKRVLLKAHESRKVIGLICIAPVIGAAVFGQTLHPSLTIGNDRGTGAAINRMGAKHVNTAPTDICVDAANRIVSTPAYMCNESPAPVFDGIGKLVDKVLELVAAK